MTHANNDNFSDENHIKTLYFFACVQENLAHHIFWHHFEKLRGAFWVMTEKRNSYFSSMIVSTKFVGTFRFYRIRW